MSGADWLAVAIMAGALVATFVFDWLAARRHHDYDAASHRRLLNELERQS